jgi:hypothetical protein
MFKLSPKIDNMRKFHGCLLVISFYYLVIGCSQKIQPYSPEVNFLYKETQGTIAVKSTGYGKNRTEAVVDAQKNALRTIMFYGIPGTELNIPLIENVNEAKSKKSKYLNDFFENDNYANFIMSFVESSDLTKVKGGKKITVDVKINFSALRKDLEQNQVIRKFGY